MDNSTIEKMYDRFSRIPGFWDLDAWTCRATSTSPYRAKVIDQLKLTDASKVLDVACGTGLNFTLLENAIGAAGQLVGIDQSKKTLALARRRVNRKNWENIDLLATDAASFTTEAPFDAALCTFAIDIIPPWRETIDMMVAAVAPGGRIGFIGFKESSKRPYHLFNKIFRTISVPFGGVELNRNVRDYLAERCEESFYEEVYGGFYYLLVGTRRS
jgi:ubiquinone/menaquinone biosynthesis C-methylase UbiE